MEAPLFKSYIKDTDIEIIGFLIVNREYISNSTYDTDEQCCMIAVNDFTMPESDIRGLYKVDANMLVRYGSVAIK